MRHDEANEIFVELLAYHATSRDFYRREKEAELAGDEAAKARAVQAWEDWEDGNTLPRYYAIVDRIKALPVSANRNAALVMRELYTGMQAGEPIKACESYGMAAFALEIMVPLLTGPIARMARSFIENPEQTPEQTGLWAYCD